MADENTNNGSLEGAAPAFAAGGDAGENSAAFAPGKRGSLPRTSATKMAEQLREQVAALLKTEVEELGNVGTPDGDWALVTANKLDEKRLLELYSTVSGIEILDEDEPGDILVFPELTFDFLSSNNCLPLVWDSEKAVLAIANPYDAGRIAMLWKNMFFLDARFVLARRAYIERYISSLYDNAGADSENGKDSDSEQALRDLAREAPIVRLVNDIFNRAQEMFASDIHVEPAETEVLIRFRIDGLLQTVMRPPKSQYAAIASRIKLLAGMNIAERRLPQDGRIELAGATPIDVRVSTVPCMHGESIVLRLLQKDSAIFDLDKVGLLPDNRAALESMFNMPHGMILVVGPTGSGKTTTLYCIMAVLNADYRKIITIEDPVEYQMEGLTQIHVKSQIGLTFASGLRAIVRQDPDVILVGEIRDRETAEIAIHAALTGHLVLSTLHTNDAAGAVTRLVEMGVEGFLISSSLLGIVSQRLVRRICPKCGGTGKSVEEPGRRCRNCMGSGYRGRIAIFELMQINDELRAAINAHKDTTELTAIARRHGMRTLREDGDLKVAQHLTTESEVTRVCMLDLENI
ncbi:MAG: type II/IV secretion system protein [Victivallales bacterium]|nr:type II/IV secretion system protein [Victivallales bacterium]